MITKLFKFTVDGNKQTPVDAKLLKDGKQIPNKDIEIIVSDNKVVFKLKKASRDLSGKYQIKLSNGQGEDTKDVDIIMQTVPSAPQEVDAREIFQNSCVIKFKKPKDDGGSPIIKYIFEKQDLTAKSGWDAVAEVTGDRDRCKIEDLIHKHQYKFRVKAVNKLGESEPGHLAKTVLAKDPWDEPGKPKNVEPVDWDVDHADISWQKPDSDGGAPITAYIIEFKEKFAKDWTKSQEVPANQTTATVQGLKEGSQYEFRVKAVNKAGPGEPSDATKPIIAKCRFVKPFIVGDELNNIVIKKGQVVKYDIKYGGEPEPEVTWEVSSREIKEDTEQRITIDKYERNTVLQVRRCIRSDSGKYALVLKNSSGVYRSEADVVILDRPTPPMGPLEAVEVRANHIKVQWMKPKDNGGTPITGYLLEKMDIDTGRWVPAGECDANQNDFVFKNLTKGKKYKFRVKAYNKEGESDPLEASEAIKAANPYGEFATKV